MSTDVTDQRSPVLRLVVVAFFSLYYDNIPSKLLMPACLSGCIFVSCTFTAHRILMGYASIPPNPPANIYSGLCNIVNDIITPSNLFECMLLFGGYNLPITSWDFSRLHESASSIHLLLVERIFL